MALVQPATRRGGGWHDRGMAKKTLIIDDLTGDTGAKTRAFKLDGVEYEIDLTIQGWTLGAGWRF